MREDKQEFKSAGQRSLPFCADELCEKSPLYDQPIGLCDFCQLQEEAGMIKNREVEQIFRDR